MPKARWLHSADISDGIYIPKYYNEDIGSELDDLRSTHSLVTVADLVSSGAITVATGDEIGKAAYGTGDIPFVRTSDVANWEVKTAPKQGVSREIYELYAAKQNVSVGDILFVRDGTYLIGRNCFITEVDGEILYQSHVLKIHVVDEERISPAILFLAFNSSLVQRQIRSKQFTADTIDTIGQRFYELVIPVPKDASFRQRLDEACVEALSTRAEGKALIQHMPTLVEAALKEGAATALDQFLSLDVANRAAALTQRTVRSEFGEFTSRWLTSSAFVDDIYLPKYYDPTIADELAALGAHCDLVPIGQLLDSGVLESGTGDEPGKAVYGTGDIPFLRTSDFTNWEVAVDPKQGVAEAVYDAYQKSQNLKAHDILLVRDGTYLVGSSCIVTSHDAKALYAGGLIRLRVLKEPLTPYLLLALINSFIVKRQFRAKQFTRDVIDTMGNRYKEVILPIPRDPALRAKLANAARDTVTRRIEARVRLRLLAEAVVTLDDSELSLSEPPSQSASLVSV